MNKFAKNIAASNREIKAKRATAMSKEAEASQMDLIRELEKKANNLDNRLMDLEDLAPETTTSLRTNFVASEWVEKVHATKVELRLLNIEIKIAKETYAEFFVEEEAAKEEEED